MNQTESKNLMIISSGMYSYFYNTFTSTIFIITARAIQAKSPDIIQASARRTLCKASCYTFFVITILQHTYSYRDILNSLNIISAYFLHYPINLRLHLYKSQNLPSQFGL